MSKEIYVWKYQTLATRLRDGAIGKRGMRVYTVLFALMAGLYTLASVLSLLGGGPVFSTLIDVAFISIWFGVTYLVNKRGDGKDFLKRFMSFSTPIMVRVIVIGLGFSLTVALFFAAVGLAAAFAPVAEDSIIATIGGAEGKMVATLSIVVIWFGLMFYSLYAFVKGFRIAAGRDAQG